MTDEEWKKWTNKLLNIKLTPELVNEIQSSLKEIADKYEKDCWNNRITLEWLNKPFSEL